MPRQRLIAALCAGVVLGASPLSFFSTDATGFATAQAQQLDRATQVLFLAVEKNDLPGVQAAINGGADITARQINGMQAVDLAIERGYFDIAHYLISVRNQLDAQGKTAKTAPSLEQLAQTQRAKQAVTAPPQPTLPPAPDLPPGSPNPFDAPRASNGLPVIGDVREPMQTAPAATEVAQTDPTKADARPEAPTKPSATKSFFTTFTDFFKPPNTTGIVRRDTSLTPNEQGALTDVELSKQIQEIDAEIGDALIKGPVVPMSPDELAKELPPAPEIPADIAALGGAPLDTPALPPYRVTGAGTTPQAAPPPQTPEASGKDAFGDLKVADVTAEDNQPAEVSRIEQPFENVLDTSLPFGGGVDPDILALLGMGPAGTASQAASEPTADSDPFGGQIANADPFASSPAETDPFAASPSDTKPDSVASVLEGLDTPQEIAPLKTKTPSLPGDGSGADGAVDPFATPEGASDPFATPPQGEVDELAGLLEGIGEKVATKQDGWDVKEVENASLSGQVPVLTDITPTGEPLDGIELTLGADAAIGQAVGEDRMQMMDQETIHKPCLQKGGPETVFCVDKVSWPFELEEDFLVDTIMYQGTRSIARYDAGRASYFHALFNTGAFVKVVNYYISRFGQPTEKIERAIAPLAQPRRDNPTYIWRTREPGTDSIITLEIRQFDDARGGFPDTRRGAILLYREHSGGIFPLLSQLELMVLKETGQLELAPITPESIW